MLLILGLGNPGDQYKNSRHNAGFIALDRLRDVLGYDQFYDIGDWKSDKDYKADICWARGGVERKILMVKPSTFMNNSGMSARAVFNRFKLESESEFVLIHDDLDLELGSYKLQKSKSPKKHNGVISVEHSLGVSNFYRLRIGVDSRDGDRTISPEDYVLTKFDKDERIILDECVASALRDLRTTFSF